MKSDRIQGILFETTEPVLLKQKAANRSRSVTVKDDSKRDTFLEKVQSLKKETGRLARRKTGPMIDAVLHYEAYLPSRRAKK